MLYIKKINKWNEFVEEQFKERKEIYLEGASFIYSNLEMALFKGSHLEGVRFFGAHLKWASFTNSHLKGSKFNISCLTRTVFDNSHLEGAKFNSTHLKGATFRKSHLKGATFRKSHLKRTTFDRSYLEGVNFVDSHFDNTSHFLNSHISRDINLDSDSILQSMFSPGLKQTFEYVKRRRNWIDWYRKHKILKLFVQPFWWLSDYGYSTKRVIVSFLGFSLLFSLLYYLFPGLLCKELTEAIDPENRTVLNVFNRCLNFSIVSMTTIGMGDINVNGNSFWGHIVLAINVIIGYVILGALITRLSILFGSDGPARGLVKKKWKFENYLVPILFGLLLLSFLIQYGIQTKYPFI